MDGDFPTVESLQEVAKAAVILAEAVERCGGDAPLLEDIAANAPGRGQAVAAAEFFQACDFHHHRGVHDCGDKIVVFGNRGYRDCPGTVREVQLIREHLEKIGLLHNEFGITADGYSWAIVALNYQRLPVNIDELRKKLWEIWSAVADEFVPSGRDRREGELAQEEEQ
jgi:hypothetical protein